MKEDGHGKDNCDNSSTVRITPSVISEAKRRRISADQKVATIPLIVDNAGGSLADDLVTIMFGPRKGDCSHIIDVVYPALLFEFASGFSTAGLKEGCTMTCALPTRVVVDDDVVVTEWPKCINREAATTKDASDLAADAIVAKCEYGPGLVSWYCSVVVAAAMAKNSGDISKIASVVGAIIECAARVVFLRCGGAIAMTHARPDAISIVYDGRHGTPTTTKEIQVAMKMASERNADACDMLFAVPSSFAIVRPFAWCSSCKGLAMCRHGRLIVSQGRALVSAHDLLCSARVVAVTRFMSAVGMVAACGPASHPIKAEVVAAHMIGAERAGFWDAASVLETAGYSWLLSKHTDCQQTRIKNVCNLSDKTWLPGYNILSAASWDITSLSVLLPPCLRKIVDECTKSRHPNYYERTFIGTFIATIKGFESDAEGLYETWKSLFRHPGRPGVPSSSGPSSEKFNRSEYGRRGLEDVIACACKMHLGCTFAIKRGICPLGSTHEEANPVCLTKLNNSTGVVHAYCAPKQYYAGMHSSVMGLAELCAQDIDMNCDVEDLYK